MMAILPMLPILRSLKKHQLIVFILLVQVALSFAVVCNLVMMANHRLLAKHQHSGLREAGLGTLSFSDRLRMDEGDRWGRIRDSMLALERVPGVQGVTVAPSLPLGGNSYNVSFSRQPTGQSGGVARVAVSVFFGAPNMIDVLGLKVIRGRNFTHDEFVRDPSKSAALAMAGSIIVSEQLAHRLFRDVDALGQLIYVDDRPLRIVGMVGHLLSPSPGLGSDNELTAIVPILPGDSAVDFVIRGEAASIDRLLESAAQVLINENPGAVIEGAQSFDVLRARFFQHDVAVVRLLIVASVAMLMVMVIGVAGLSSFWVASRGKSMGIRRALGAGRRAIVAHVLLENLCIVCAGLVVGMVGAYALNAYLIRQYGETHLTPGYLLFGSLLLVFAGLAAVMGPAMRAASVPPSAAMRGR